MPSIKAAFAADASLQQKLEFLVLWMMATSNRVCFVKGAVDETGQHWKLSDPAEEIPEPDEDSFFNALSWVDDVEPFLNNTAFMDGTEAAPGPGVDFLDVNNDFYAAANKPLLRAAAAPYDDHLCPPLAEVQTLIQAIDNAAS